MADSTLEIYKGSKGSLVEINTINDNNEIVNPDFGDSQNSKLEIKDTDLTVIETLTGSSDIPTITETGVQIKEDKIAALQEGSYVGILTISSGSSKAQIFKCQIRVIEV